MTKQVQVESLQDPLSKREDRVGGGAGRVNGKRGGDILGAKSGYGGAVFPMRETNNAHC